MRYDSQGQQGKLTTGSRRLVCGLSWLQGKYANRIETQASGHKASKEQKIKLGQVRAREQAKIAREYHLPAIR